jgi:hypothetical protein
LRLSPGKLSAWCGTVATALAGAFYTTPRVLVAAGAGWVVALITYKVLERD